MKTVWKFVRWLAALIITTTLLIVLRNPIAKSLTTLTITGANWMPVWLSNFILGVATFFAENKIGKGVSFLFSWFLGGPGKKIGGLIVSNPIASGVIVLITVLVIVYFAKVPKGARLSTGAAYISMGVGSWLLYLNLQNTVSSLGTFGLIAIALVLAWNTVGPRVKRWVTQAWNAILSLVAEAAVPLAKTIATLFGIAVVILGAASKITGNIELYTTSRASLTSHNTFLGNSAAWALDVIYSIVKYLSYLGLLGLLLVIIGAVILSLQKGKNKTSNFGGAQ